MHKSSKFYHLITNGPMIAWHFGRAGDNVYKWRVWREGLHGANLTCVGLSWEVALTGKGSSSSLKPSERISTSGRPRSSPSRAGSPRRRLPAGEHAWLHIASILDHLYLNCITSSFIIKSLSIIFPRVFKWEINTNFLSFHHSNNLLELFTNINGLKMYPLQCMVL